jgi:putative intracellular protease/amidase
MTTRNVAVLIFDGFADWEPAYALTGLRRWGNRSIVTVGYHPGAVVSMGGMRVVPDDVLETVTPASTELLILPGGDQWLDSYPAARIDAVVRQLTDAGVPVAAICAATVAMARGGFLKDRRHTSNGAAFLEEHAPGYETSPLYGDALAVVDRGVITASGLGAAEFADAIFATLGIFDDANRALYLDMYRRGVAPAGL